MFCFSLPLSLSLSFYLMTLALHSIRGLALAPPCLTDVVAHGGWLHRRANLWQEMCHLRLFLVERDACTRRTQRNTPIILNNVAFLLVQHGRSAITRRPLLHHARPVPVDGEVFIRARQIWELAMSLGGKGSGGDPAC